MHVLAILDSQRLQDEERMITRIFSGLKEHGCRSTLVIPSRLPDSLGHVHSDGLGADTILTTSIPMSFWQRRRGRGGQELVIDESPDVIWALGEATHQLASRISGTCQVPAVFDIRSIQGARKAVDRDGTVGGWITPGPALAKIVSKRVGPELVECIRPGVEPGAARIREPEHGPSIAILGAGEDTASMHALLSSLPGIIKQVPGMQICIEVAGPTREATWRELRSLELLEHVSTVPGAAGVHDLLAQCDIFIQPDRHAPARTIVLEAMKNESSIISARIPHLDWLVDGETAVLVNKPRRDAWTEAVLRLLQDPALQQRLGQAARRHVLAHHGLQGHLDSLLGTFRRATRGFSYPFTLQGTT